MGELSVQTKLFRCDGLTSYLELCGKDLQRCLYCDKTSTHDHDIFGKIKFCPKDVKAFISLVVSSRSDEKKAGALSGCGEGASRDDCENIQEMKQLHSFILEGVMKASNEKKAVHKVFKTKNVELDIQIPSKAPNHSEACVSCDQDSALTLPLIKKHFSTKHGVLFHKPMLSTTKFQCADCLGAFKDEASLKRHSVRHTEGAKERRFTCQICNKRFLKQSHLESHNLSHSGMKPFECMVCSKKYTSEFALKNHRTHVHNEGDKPKCNECQKTFYTNSSLRKHILRFHSKDSRLQCPECSQIYLRKDNLQKHIALVHKGPSEDPADISYKNELEEEIDGLFRPSKGGNATEVLNISGGLDASATEALLKNLTPQPDYLLKSLTPIPLEALEEMLLGTQ